MHIDEATLYVIVGCAALIAGAAFCGLRYYAKEVPGVVLWGLGYLGIGVSMLVVGEQTLFGDKRIVSLAFNLPHNCGLLLVLAGTMRFCGTLQGRKLLWPLGAIEVIGIFLFTLVFPDARIRIIFLALLAAMMSVWGAVILWRRPDTRSEGPYRLASAMNLLQALALLTRAGLVLSAPIHVTPGSPEVPLGNQIAAGVLLLNMMASSWMLILLVALRLVADLRSAAERDALTGLLNRRGMRLALDTLLSRRAANGLRQIGVMLLDIDHFKSINDTHGHDVGDKVLKVMGEVLLHAAPPTHGVAARWGGEEFCIVMECAGEGEVVEVAEKIRSRFTAATALLQELSSGRTVSIGIALSQNPSQLDISRLISTADAQLYRAKQTGRDRVEVCRSELAPS